MSTTGEYVASEASMDDLKILSASCQAKEFTHILLKTIVEESFGKPSTNTLREAISHLNQLDDTFLYLCTLVESSTSLFIQGNKEQMRVIVQGYYPCHCTVIPSTTGILHRYQDYVPETDRVNTVSLTLTDVDKMVITDMSNGDKLYLKCHTPLFSRAKESS